MKYLLFLGFALSLHISINAQNTLELNIQDAITNEPLIGANVILTPTNSGAISDLDGKVQFLDLPYDHYEAVISYIGYKEQVVLIDFKSNSRFFEILLEQNSEELEEIVISSNRANRSIANVPSRIEVITDEIEEAATMDPSKIAHLLMHTTGIQVQQTSATSGTASVRIQGQYGRYTQILKDGFPIYGGFTGGLGVLQIPPLDLKQVEFIKGSSSTLYGGGAIAGIINLISKEPKEKEEASAHINLSHIGNMDLNSFYSKRAGKWGITLFASNNTNTVYDVDEDGFSDVPEVRKFNFNPRLFYYLNENTTISLGGTFTNENRIGGDVDIVEGSVVDSLNNYFERNKSKQTTTQFKISHILPDKSLIEVRNSTNHFKRNIFLNNYSFAGTQFSSFSEISYSKDRKNQNFIIGINLYSDKFTEQPIDTDQVRDQKQITAGIFTQHIWDISSTFAIESGIRIDYNDDYGTFPLPKLSVIYKPNLKFTARIGAGMGYKLPSIFTEEAESLAFEKIVPINSDVHVAEKSYGVNADLTFRLITTDKVSLSITEFFFYNKLNNPLLLSSSSMGVYEFINSGGYFETKGIESLIKASAGNFHLYLGYTFVNASLNENDENVELPLTPQHSIHSDLMFVVDGIWRVGIDAEYESEQTLASGRRVQSLFKAGFLAERTFNNLSVYINLENWTDTRQTNYESLVQEPFKNPRFTEVWAPLDGFIFNAGLKLKI